MKNCLCCGAECASDAPHCLACGEASFGPVVAAAFPLAGMVAILTAHGQDGALELPDAPRGEPTGEEPPEVLQEPNDPIPGVAAAPAKRGPGRPKKDAPN